MFLRLREIFTQVLRELNDLENPLRTSVADPAGDVGPGSTDQTTIPGVGRARGGDGAGTRAAPEIDPSTPAVARQRRRALPAWRLLPFPEDRRHLRSEFDAEARVILVNELHPDYRAAREEGSAHLHYLTWLTAKELALWQNPHSDALATAEDMIRILVRARRHLPEKG